MSPGTVRVGKDKGVNAFQKQDKEKDLNALGSSAGISSRIIRIRNQGDPVAASVFSAKEIVFSRRKEGQLNPLNNHKLLSVNGAYLKHAAQDFVSAGIQGDKPFDSVKRDADTDRSLGARLKYGALNILNKVGLVKNKPTLAPIISKSTGFNAQLGFETSLDQMAAVVAYGKAVDEGRTSIQWH